MSAPPVPAGDQGVEQFATMHAAALDQPCQGAGYRWRRKPEVAIERMSKLLVRKPQDAALPQFGSCVNLHVVASLCHAHLTLDSAEGVL